MRDNRISENVVISENVIIGSNVEIGEGTVIESGCVIGNNVVIGKNVTIDYSVIIRDNVKIGHQSSIGAKCILGEYLLDYYTGNKSAIHPLSIGENALIRSETIIYGENSLGHSLQTGHRVTIRENSKIGNNVRIGTLCDIQGYCEIQDYVNIHSNVHIGQKSVIQKYVWIFPYVVLTNDPNPPSESLLGVTVEEFAIISTGSIILPGVVIKKEALVGAGAIVTKDVEKSMVAVGNPARMICNTDKIKDHVTGKQVYPWKYTFERGMPWQDIGYETWRKERNEDYV